MTYVTEKQAEDMVCPHIRVPDRWNVGIETQTVYVSNVCQGSKCMAWRWAGGLPSTEKGYCGLSGRPGPDLLGYDEVTGKTTIIG